MKHHALWRLRGQEMEGQIATRGALIKKLEKDTPRKISITRQRHVADKKCAQLSAETRSVYIRVSLREAN